MSIYNVKQLANLIDHTNLKPYANKADMEKLCDEAKEYNFKMVAINQVQTQLCAEYLAGTEVGIGAAIGFPLGQTTIAVKVFETKNAIENGATEIDYVINLSEVKNNNFSYIKDEMKQIVDICRDNQVISKVIFENAYLTKEEIITLAEIAKEVKPDFIKTSTGMAPSGASPEDVRLMKETVGADVKVKAAGGVRDLETFIKMVENGAERIGSSSGIKIIEELSELLEEQETDTLTIEQKYK